MSQPFHAGGAANLGLLQLPSHGLEIIKSTLLPRIHELDFREYGSVVAVVGIVPIAWRLLRTAWREITTWIKHFFIASVTIPAGDALNGSVSAWVIEHVIEPRHLRFHTARTEISGRDMEPGSSLRKTQRSIQYLPHWDTTYFWHESRLFSIAHSLDAFHASMNNTTYDGVGGEELTVSCLGLSVNPIRSFIDTCRAHADRKSQYYVIIYARDRYGMSWKPKTRKPLRHLDTIHFDDSVKRGLLADLRNYLDPRTHKLYQSRNMPYRRGYLFYGPPGSGKSSLSTAIAGEFGMDLYEVKVPSIANDADLEQMFQEIPPRCIVLLEDIDAIWTGREQHQQQQQYERHMHDTNSEKSVNSNNVSHVTLSGLLNALDGVSSNEGRIMIMTTNKPERLDPALIRPGRVDFRVRLGNINRRSAEDMFIRMFSPDLVSWSSQTADGLEKHITMEQLRLLASQFAQEIPDDTFTPSQLQGFFQLHLDSVFAAVSNVRAWVQRELAAKCDKDFEIC